MFLYISAYNLCKNFTWLIVPEIVLFSINCKRASLPQLSHSIRQVAFSSFVSWMARPRPNRETAWCTATWHRVTLISHLTPIRLTHVAGYVISLAFQPGWSPLQHRAPLSSLLLYPPPLLFISRSSFRKENERQREREDRASFVENWVKIKVVYIDQCTIWLIYIYIYIDTLELWVDIIVIIVVEKVISTSTKEKVNFRIIISVIDKTIRILTQLLLVFVISIRF